jgi:iron complex transport system substrate-binding protein
MAIRFIVALLMAFAGTQAMAFPIQVIDALDREVVIPGKPERIVAIFSSNTEMLVALGLADRIVGIDAYTRYPAEIADLPKIGGRLGFSTETIARLNPDLVVMTPARQAANTLLKPLATIAVPAVVLVHHDIERIFKNILFLGRVTGETAAAEALIDGLRERLAVIAQCIADKPPKRVYFETGNNDRGGFMTLREGTYTADALRLAGGVNVFAHRNLLAQVSGEAVLLADPDVILVARYGEEAVAEVKSRVGWHRLKAVQTDRVYQVDRTLLLIPGPRIVAGIEQMARLLHPGCFSAPGDA